MKKIVLLLAFLGLSLFFVQAQKLELQDIVEKKYAAQGVDEIRSMSDGEHYTMLSADRKSVLKYAYKTGEVVEALFNVDNARETKLEEIDGYLINSTGTHILVWTDTEYIYRRSFEANYYDYDVRRNFLKPLSDTEGKIMFPTFSTDGRMCAFVRDNNIWIKKFDYDTEIQITKDGAFGSILNGRTDWVYEEEFVLTNLMTWSPDNKFLAYLKSNEEAVPSFSFEVFNGSLYPPVYTYKYPKPGENNSQVSCYVYNVETKDTKKMQVPVDEDGYITMVRFTGNPDQLAVMTLNRHQNSLKMFFVNPKSTVAKLVLQDDNSYYVDPSWSQKIRFSDNNFVYVSEKDGYAHIYLYTITGVLEKQLTSGNWDVTNIYGFNPQTKTVYYQSAEESPLKRAIYKVDAKGNKTKLSKESGTNVATFSNKFQYFVNNFSNTGTPNKIAIYNEKGKEVKLLNDNAELKNTLAGMNIPKKEFITIPNASGESLNAWILKPTNFDSNKRYPLVMLQYSGPDSQEVKDKYEMDWYYYLCNQGYVVVTVDTRGTGARGQEFRKCTYLKLGILESDDLIATAKHFSNQSYIDESRMAIWGWSYGGFMTLMSMSRGNGIFKAGIAIAPVTDWRYYDSVYTERFMRTPQENFSNYDLCSPIKLAPQLQGDLLLIHGTADDNVHYQNTMYYSDALVNAGKQFDMQIYSNNNHSLVGVPTRAHLYTRIINFLNKNL